MKQINLAIAGFELVAKRTLKRVFPGEMNFAFLWADLVGLIGLSALGSTRAKGGHPSFSVKIMLHIHFLQQWLGLSDPATQEALHDILPYYKFARLDPGRMRLPDESTILRFQHLLEEHKLSIHLTATINATLATKDLLP